MGLDLPPLAITGSEFRFPVQLYYRDKAGKLRRNACVHSDIHGEPVKAGDRQAVLDLYIQKVQKSSR